MRSMHGSMKPGVSEQLTTFTSRMLVSSTVTSTLVASMIAGEPKRSPSMEPFGQRP